MRDAGVVKYVVLPAIDDEAWPAWIENATSVEVLTPRSQTNDTGDRHHAQWLAHTALEIARFDDQVVLVCVGKTCALAPRLGFACRSARRPVHGYLLIDGPLPPADTRSDWPDAPVTVVCDGNSDVARQASLRGWRLLSPPTASSASVDFAHWDELRLLHE